MTEATADTATDLLKLEEFIRDEDAFTRAFKHKLTDPAKLGAGAWAWDEKARAFGIVTPNGSLLALKFFDTVKVVYDYMNVEVLGKESSLSYIEVVVRPAGIKGYMFKSDLLQSVWGDSKSKALVKHAAGLDKLRAKALTLGIEVADNQWRHEFDRMSY